MSSSSFYLFSILLLLTACGTPPVAESEAEEMTEAAMPSPAAMTSDSLPPVLPAEVDSAALFGPTAELDYLRGRFEPSGHPLFTALAAKLTDGDGTYYLRKDAAAAFAAMQDAARADGISLQVISATRNFERQKGIWEAKWTGKRLLEGTEKADEVYPDPAERALAILRYSSMPGTSRHHWGTDIDINQLTNEYFRSGKGAREYAWLTANAAEYGFCQPYSTKVGPAGRPFGYEEERWHWSYLPAARPLTRRAAARLRDADIAGFAGSEAAARIKVVERYVLGINPACKTSAD